MAALPGLGGLISGLRKAKSNFVFSPGANTAATN